MQNAAGLTTPPKNACETGRSDLIRVKIHTKCGGEMRWEEAGPPNRVKIACKTQPPLLAHHKNANRTGRTPPYMCTNAMPYKMQRRGALKRSGPATTVSNGPDQLTCLKMGIKCGGEVLLEEVGPPNCVRMHTKRSRPYHPNGKSIHNRPDRPYTYKNARKCGGEGWLTRAGTPNL